MRPFVRVRMLHANDYRVLKKISASRKMPAGKVRRANTILLSNLGYVGCAYASALCVSLRAA